MNDESRWNESSMRCCLALGAAVAEFRRARAQIGARHRAGGVASSVAQAPRSCSPLILLESGCVPRVGAARKIYGDAVSIAPHRSPDISVFFVTGNCGPGMPARYVPWNCSRASLA
jgi:hypothetical protein